VFERTKEKMINGCPEFFERLITLEMLDFFVVKKSGRREMGHKG
jgi:hypothetical protein